MYCEPALGCVITSSAQGSDGMKYSLISRDWIADCVEIMHEAYAAVSMCTLTTMLSYAIIDNGGFDNIHSVTRGLFV